MKKTKLLSITLVLCLMLSFVGCKSDSKKDEDSFDGNKNIKPSVTETDESVVPTAENEATPNPASTVTPGGNKTEKDPTASPMETDSLETKPEGDSEFTTIYDSNGVKSLPYESQGITIKEFDVTDDYITATITNNSNITIEDISSFFLKIYYPGISEISETRLYLDEIAPGESVIVNKYLTEIPSKILVGSAEIFEKTAFTEVGTSFYDGTALIMDSFDYKGIIFEKSPFSENQIKITNNTGFAVEDFCFGIKYYNKDGIVIGSNVCYVPDLNNSESTLQYIIAEENASKILFGDVMFVEGEEFVVDALSENNGLITNTLPYSENGIVINTVTYNDGIAYVNIMNETGKRLDDYALWVKYKAYNSRNEVLASDYKNIGNLENGKSAVLEISLFESDITKLVFNVKVD